MRRRELITFGAAAAVASPLVASAQQPANLPRIGYLRFGSAAASANRVAALRAGLRDLGYLEGKNIVIEFRWAERFEQLAEFAGELAAMKVDVILAVSSTEVEAVRQATKTIPIVFINHADPVSLGHVQSLPRPGGNITGLSMLLTELVAKELEILHEAVPGARRIGVLFSPNAPAHRPTLHALEIAGQKLGISLYTAPVATVDDFAGAFSTIAREGVGAFLVVASPLTLSGRRLLAKLALKHRLPGIFGIRENVEAGGLMSYGADLNDLSRRAAIYIDKLLKGAQPADLPVEQASKFELVINLKTAEALGLTIPPSILARADEVVE
jgi:putative tryptophan/tyrosine transport system substrate-binding protein